MTTNNTTIQTKAEYFGGFATITTMAIETPTTFTFKHGAGLNKVTLVSGEYDHSDKAMRGRDADGRIWFIELRTIVTVEH
jgi:hypothetical protein